MYTTRSVPPLVNYSVGHRSHRPIFSAVIATTTVAPVAPVFLSILLPALLLLLVVVVISCLGGTLPVLLRPMFLLLLFLPPLPPTLRLRFTN